MVFAECARAFLNVLVLARASPTLPSAFSVCSCAYPRERTSSSIFFAFAANSLLDFGKEPRLSEPRDLEQAHRRELLLELHSVLSHALDLRLILEPPSLPGEFSDLVY